MKKVYFCFDGLAGGGGIHHNTGSSSSTVPCAPLVILGILFESFSPENKCRFLPAGTSVFNIFEKYKF